VLARLFDRQVPEPVFKTPFLYRSIRHPIYLSFLVAFWSTPVMSAGHLLFSLATTGYILIAIQLEERDLILLFGDQYRRYRREVAMLFPLPRRKSAGRAVSDGGRGQG
jgi:methanethiol S-methyltransferase